MGRANAGDGCLFAARNHILSIIMLRILPCEIEAGIIDLAQAAACEEVCGFVGGNDGIGTLVLPVENQQHKIDSFEMTSEALLAALVEIDRLGFQVEAVYHSHPILQPEPSDDDYQKHVFPFAAILIASRYPSGWQLRAFDPQKRAEIGLARIVTGVDGL